MPCLYKPPVRKQGDNEVDSVPCELQLRIVTVQMYSRFVRFSFCSVLPVRKKGKTDEDGGQLNGYCLRESEAFVMLP